MNKELTPLEAFKKIKELAWLNTEDSDKTEECINIIENSLKEKELQDNALKVIKEVICFARKVPEVQVNEDGDFCGIVSAVGMRVQREIENKERELFREWVLKTCFPKELKSLEIIKNKKVNVWYLFIIFNEMFGDADDYNQSVINNEYKLTQEEYDLLKEILL